MLHTIDLQFLGIANSIAAFLLETTEGPVLFETGPHTTTDKLETALHRYGYAPQDIKHVFVTHIHLDHAGAAWHWANYGAKIYVHPIGLPHLADPSRLMSSAKRIYQTQMDFLWGRMEAIAPTQLHATQHAELFQIGNHSIKAWHTPGHAIHHIAWQIDDTALVAGDVAGVRINGGMPVPPCPPPDINLEDWQQSIALLKNLPLKKLYLTHFGLFDDVTAHLEALEKNLYAWAEWIYPYWQQKTDRDKIVPLFAEFVRQQMVEYGVRPEDFARYEAANPAYMSVTGLLRYWTQREAIQP